MQLYDYFTDQIMSDIHIEDIPPITREEEDIHIITQEEFDNYIYDTAPEQCSICLQTIIANDKITNPCCKNSFCTSCIYKNISLGNTTCPLCRHNHIKYKSTPRSVVYEVETDLETDDEYVNEHIIGLENSVRQSNIRNERIRDINFRLINQNNFIKEKYSLLLNQYMYYKTLLIYTNFLPSYDEDDINYDIFLDIDEIDEINNID